MKEIELQTIEPGRYFTEPVYLDEKYVLLSPETPMPEELLERIHEWGFKSVLSEGDLTEQAPDPNGAEIAGEAPLLSYQADLKEREQLQETRSFYHEMLEYTEHLFTNFVSKNELSQRAVSEKIKHLIEAVRRLRKFILRLAEMESGKQNYVVEHSVKTTILAIAVGNTMKLPTHKLIELGTAALLHEIGMVRLPPQLYMSQKELTPQERKAITAHTILGFKVLKQFSFPMPVCLAVLECREKLDGTGYPRGLPEEKISVYAKVIAVCGSFAALTSRRPFRPAYPAHASILELLKERGKAYDETVLRALVVTVSIYPIGSYVLLENGARGMVVDTNTEDARAPNVRVLSGPDGRIYSEPPTVATTSPEYHIVRALNAEETKELNRHRPGR